MTRRGNRINRNKDPQAVGDLLDDVLEKLGVARPLEVTHLVAEWGDVAGEPWAGRSVPVGLAGGVLVVEVADATTASLLKYQKQALIGRLDDRVGKGLVTEVRVRVGRAGRSRREGS